jgi:hypothetical protein
LQYLTTFTVDLAKLIKYSLENSDLKKEKLRELILSLDPTNEEAIVGVAFQLFKRYVIFDTKTTS